jgi:hypothetical protein
MIATIQWFMSLFMVFLIFLPMPTSISRAANVTIQGDDDAWDLNSSGWINATTLVSETVLTYPVTTSNFYSYLTFSAECIFGDFMSTYPETISTLNYTSNSIPPTTFDTRGIQCFGIGYELSFFMIINVIYNISNTDILKLTTSNISAIIGIFTLVVTNFAFAVPFLAGVAYQTPRMWDVVALVAASIGIVSFWSMPETIPKDVMQKLTAAAANQPTKKNTWNPLERPYDRKCCPALCPKARPFITISSMATRGEDDNDDG